MSDIPSAPVTTLEDFYTALTLAREERDWVVEPQFGLVLADRDDSPHPTIVGAVTHGGICPVIAVAKSHRLNAQFVMEAARELGLPREVAVAIIHAADNSPRHDPAVRKRLLEILGLEDVAVQPLRPSKPKRRVVPSKASYAARSLFPNASDSSPRPTTQSSGLDRPPECG